MKTPIFLFGSGRCGSTLVQRAINAHPAIVMYGEHEGFLGPIANSYHKLMKTADVDRFIYGKNALPADLLHGPLKDIGRDICWINNFTREDVLREHRTLVLNLLARDLDLDKIHWGFKEIRYREGHHVLWFLREIFTECRFVFLIRNPVDTIVSGLLAWKHADEAMQDANRLARIVENFFGEWTAKYSYLLSHAGAHPEQSYLMRYEELIANPKQHMEEIFGLLDLECPPLALEIFGRKVASTVSEPGRDDLLEFVRSCRDRSKNEGFCQLVARYEYA